MAERSRAMKKHLTLPISIEVIRHSSQVVVRVVVDPNALRDWCLSLCLLKEGLTEGLLISEARGKQKLEIETTGTPVDRLRAKLMLAADRTQLRVSHHDLGYLLHFFLKYYRDGIGEVDHLDLQAVSGEEGDMDCYATFIILTSRPPVSAEEAKRRLGSG
jgi:hypothetical protein